MINFFTYGISTPSFNYFENKYNNSHIVYRIFDSFEDANEYATYAMQLNMQDADDFEELSLNSYDIAIITFKDIQTSILAALVCKENNIPMVIAKANDETHKKILQKMDVDKI